MWLILNVCRGSPAAGCFLLLRQKKVTKEKATPVYRPLRGFPRSTTSKRGCGTRTTCSDSPRLSLRPLAVERGGAQGMQSEIPKP